MSSFHGIGVASSALRNLQRAMDVAGHNIANINNRGYSRQVVDFRTSDPTQFFAHGWQALGSGVSIAGVSRIRDLFLEGRHSAANSEFGRMGSLAAGLSQLEGVLNEPGSSGISAAMNRFFDAFSGLGSRPNDPAARLEAQQAGRLLGQRIRSTALDSQGVEAQLTVQVEAMAGRVNDLARTLAGLNEQIQARMGEGQSPNDLLDRRDSLIEELSSLVAIQTTRTAGGGIHVSLGGFMLVDDGGARTLPAGFDPATATFGSGPDAVRITGGRLAGTLEAISSVQDFRRDLNALANNLREQVNNLHRAGTGRNGATGLEFFAGTSAIDFGLTTEIASDPDNIAAGYGARSDGDLAMAIAQMRSQALPGLGGRSVDDFYTELVTRVGSDAAYAADEMSTRRAILDQIDMQRQSISGVSIDEEMANLLQLQRSYQAAARTLSLFDQTTADLLSIIR